MEKVLVAASAAGMVLAAAFILPAGCDASEGGGGPGGDPVPLWPEGAPGALGDGPADTPALTSFLPEGEGPFGCVIVCPGGGYEGIAEHEAEPIASWLRGLGLASFVLRYRVAPYRHPVPLSDAQRAIRLVRARSSEWKVDPARVGMIGFSAGGHLAGCAATMPPVALDPGDPVDDESSRPDALIECYPVVTFGEYTHEQSVLNLLGESPDAATRESLSVETRVTAGTPPAFIWHTSGDAAVPVQNSLLLADALARCGVPFSLHVFPGGAHGMALAVGVPGVGAWPEICAEWLAGMGFR